MGNMTSVVPGGADEVAVMHQDRELPRIVTPVSLAEAKFICEAALTHMEIPGLSALPRPVIPTEDASRLAAEAAALVGLVRVHTPPAKEKPAIPSPGQV